MVIKKDYREMVQWSIVLSGVISSFGILKSYRSVVRQDESSALLRNPSLNRLSKP